jgi:hypothetical protein
MGGVERRRELVAKGLLARKTVREIAAELAALPNGERPARCSAATIGRDALALRADWVKARSGAIEEAAAEELARLAALEAVWWPKAMATDPVATDKVLAIQRQRLALLGLGGGRAKLTVEAGSRTREGEGAQAMRVVVEYVDDWRGTPHPLAPSPTGGEGEEDGGTPPPLAPSPTGGEGEEGQRC